LITISLPKKSFLIYTHDRWNLLNATPVAYIVRRGWALIAADNSDREYNFSEAIACHLCAKIKRGKT
jgi:hypothetical protein